LKDYIYSRSRFGFSDTLFWKSQSYWVIQRGKTSGTALHFGNPNVRPMIERITGNSLSLSATVRPWVMATLPSLFSAVGIWLVLCSVSPCIAASVTQGGETGIGGRGTPIITGTPERVKIGNDFASTKIDWNTGNGSKGFVFVTANGRPPVLIAAGNEGSRVIPWIRRGNYIFDLYGDAERRTLLSTVTVSGVAIELETPSQRTESPHGQLRWLLLAVLLAVLYTALYLSSTGPVRTKFPLEPATSPQPLHIARNLVLGVAIFIFVDGVVFHTRLYTSILAPDSYAGRMAAITRTEKNRASSGLKEVLVLGDSRMAEGFSPVVANKLSSLDGFKFINLTESASAVNIWDYMLREVDPTRRRYWAIVVPYGIGFEPSSADPLRISMAAPLLRYGDCFNFASAFQRWSGRFRAFTACILRGSAFQSDVADFLEHPIARIRSVQQGPKRLQARDVYKGQDYDIAGTFYDPRTGQVTFPPRLTEAQRDAIRDSLVKPSQSETQDFLRMQRDGIQRILNRYSASSTEIVLTPVPRGPFAGLPGASMTFHAAFPIVTTQRTVFSLPEQTFDFLETPQYYFDGYHLNSKGRQRFTETLVTELVGRLRSANSNGRVHSDSGPVANRFPSNNADSDIGRVISDGLNNNPLDEAN
jgi:hypothetical protein